MLFNSGEFLLFFLPLTLALFAVVRALSRGPRALVAVLVVASLFFYAWWEPAYLVLLLGSALANFFLSRWLHSATGRARQALLVGGVAGNLALLGFYKYADFFIRNVNALSGADVRSLGLLLPLAISFFTFQQIAFLADVYQRKAKPGGLWDYLLFVAFFPQLIAGPIVHHKQVMPQFDGVRQRALTAVFVVPGLFIFCLGFAKKVFLADTLALYANPLFDTVVMGHVISVAEGWLAALTYTFQIYFDFSGYSDMAIGLALLFGIRLPDNFYSPYRARNIIEFWRRWHMTLSQFLRDYLYIPLGGNRRGRARRYLNLFATMLLGGLWHGAGWNFVIWGGLHGLYLSANHFWLYAAGRIIPERWRDATILRLAGWALTFLAVVVAWIYFRAPDTLTANRILAAMFGAAIWQTPIVAGSDAFTAWLATGAQGRLVVAGDHLLWLSLAAAIALFLPNSIQCLTRVQDYVRGRQSLAFPLGALVGILVLCALIGVSKNVTEFIYFNF